MARGLDRATQAIVNAKIETLRKAVEKGQPLHERTFGYVHSCYENKELNKDTTR